MKRISITVLAVMLLLAIFCAQALASHGDLTIKATKLYKDSSMKEYVATLPAYTALVVRSNDSYTERADSGANSYKLKSSGVVQICKVKGEWALVQTLGERGLYAFVKVEKLQNITGI